MKHITIKFDFKNVKIVKNIDLTPDTRLAIENDREIELAQYIKAYYNADPARDWDDYQQLITAAIIYNNLTSVEILWKGTYQYGGYSRNFGALAHQNLRYEGNPDYQKDVYTAAEFSNLQTFQHVLYAYANYNTLDGVEPITYSTLRSKASNNVNSKVLLYIEALEDCVLHNELMTVSKQDIRNVDAKYFESEEDSLSEDYENRLMLGKRLYEITSTFNV